MRIIAQFISTFRTKKGENLPNPSFRDLAQEEINRHAHAVKTKTTVNEQTALNSFNSYAGLDITLQELTADTIAGFEAWLLKQVAPNTAACYLRSLRSVMNRLGADGHALFRQVSTSSKKTQKRAIDFERVKTIKDLELQDDTAEALARDTFILSILCMGIPFVDLTHLTEDNLKDGHIVYRRQKTGVEVSIAIEPCIQQILDKYSDRKNRYLLPYLSSEYGTGDDERRYQNALSRYNYHLKMLAAKVHLSKLTSYTARHTWASQSYKMGVHVGVISKALGHTNLQTTMNYIKELDNSEVEQANRSVIDMLGIK